MPKNSQVYLSPKSQNNTSHGDNTNHGIWLLSLVFTGFPFEHKTATKIIIVHSFLSYTSCAVGIINLEKKLCCDEKIERIEINFRASLAFLFCRKCAQDCNRIKSDFLNCKVNSSAINLG